MKIILGSKSPRRKQLLEASGYRFEVRTQDTDETYPPETPMEEIPVYIARQKAEALKETMQPGEVLITSDTIVVLNEEVMGKPTDREDAFRMLRALSGKTHQVITGIVIRSDQDEFVRNVTTRVTFRQLTEEMLAHYIDNFQPYDKAGAYGIQEWIGLVGVAKLEGSYTNVVGLPTCELNEMLEALH